MRQRTKCCSAFSTYMENADGVPELSCKKCGRAVPEGEGDGGGSYVFDVEDLGTLIDLCERSDPHG